MSSYFKSLNQFTKYSAVTHVFINYLNIDKVA